MPNFYLGNPALGNGAFVVGDPETPADVQGPSTGDEDCVYGVGNPEFGGGVYLVGDPCLALPGQDTVPDQFTLGDFTGLDLGVEVISNTVVVAGIDAPTTIAVIDGEYRINMGSWETDPGTVSLDDAVEVRGTSSAVPETYTESILNIGGVTDEMGMTTAEADTVPDQFSFGAAQLVASGTANVESEIVTITGISIGVNLPVTFTADASLEWRKNGGSWSTGGLTVATGDTLQLRLDASASAGAAVSATALIGTIFDTFTVVTNLISGATGVRVGSKGRGKSRIRRTLK